jgi:hypothetical protein
MARKPKEELFDPFCEIDENGLSDTERLEIWRAQCWASYLAGGGGDPTYFAGEAWIMRSSPERER